VIWLFIFLSPRPEFFVAKDRPNDAGGCIILSWEFLSDSGLDGYLIFRKTLPDTTFKKIGFAGNLTSYEDNTTRDGAKYVYKVVAIRGEKVYFSETSSVVSSSPQIFHFGRINILIAIVVFTALLLYFLKKAKERDKIFIRKIAGLDAVEEAIGRATEMGRPILYVPGLGDIDYPATIASMNILGEVAKRVANYDTPLIAVNCYPVVFTVAREVVQQAFLSQGKIERFKEDYVRYLTESQFGYAGAINGIILRERPATNFFIGPFFAESLLIAETGNQTGAFQIAGTDQVLQLPFFVTSCDYTLLGEEVYAASAYLSRAPLLVGSLKAQDWGKILVLVILIVITVASFFKFNLLAILKVE